MAQLWETGLCKAFGNKHNYDAMIRTLCKVQQKEDKTVEVYMLHIHDAVVVIQCTYLECLPTSREGFEEGPFLPWIVPLPS